MEHHKADGTCHYLQGGKGHWTGNSDGTQSFITLISLFLTSETQGIFICWFKLLNQLFLSTEGVILFYSIRCVINLSSIVLYLKILVLSPSVFYDIYPYKSHILKLIVFIMDETLKNKKCDKKSQPTLKTYWLLFLLKTIGLPLLDIKYLF